MKQIYIPAILFIFFLFIAGCESSDDNFKPDTDSGFSIVFDNSDIYTSEQIEFYDFSSHLIYLKDSIFFDDPDRGTFTVFVGDNEIYSGNLFPLYSSFMPAGPVIYCAPTFYEDYIIPIRFNQYTDSDGNTNEDPRNDQRIIDELKKSNKYKAGLSCEILSVQNSETGKVKVELLLKNNDPDNLLYLDPDKMGLELFHYYTTGLIIFESSDNLVTHNTRVSQPESWDSWDINWFSVIHGYKSKTISITYDNFNTIPEGRLKAVFNFPGPGSYIKKEDLNQDNGRIWLGQLHTDKMIQFD